MSKNPTFDDVLARVFMTLDTVYQLHAPEDTENDEAGNCISCGVEFPCETEGAILEGLAEINMIMQAAKTSSDSSQQSE